MIVLYENNLQNYIISHCCLLFENCNKIQFEKIYQLNLNYYDNEDVIYIILFSEISDTLLNKLTNNLNTCIYIISRNLQELNEYNIENWYTYWSEAVNIAINKHNFNKEILKVLLNNTIYYNRCVISYCEYIYKKNNQNNILDMFDESIESIYNKGKEIIYKNKDIFNYQKNNALIETYKNLNNIDVYNNESDLSVFIFGNNINWLYELLNHSLTFSSLYLIDISFTNVYIYSIVQPNKTHSIKFNCLLKNNNIEETCISFKDFFEIFNKWIINK